MTAQQLIRRALTLNNTLDERGPLSAELAADSLVTLNDLIDEWNGESIRLFSVGRQTFSLVSGQASYTLGPGGDFDIARPEFLYQVSAIIASGTDPFETPVDLVDWAKWSRIPVKTTTSEIPRRAYITDDFPLRTVHVYPIPNTSTSSVVLVMPVDLSAFADLTTDYTFPHGYPKALRYNLAAELAIENGRPVEPRIERIAAMTKAAIAARNSRRHARALAVDPALSPTGRFSILTGEM